MIVATAGGNFKAGRNVLEPFKARIRQECPRVKFLSLIGEPALGAYALAASLLNRTPDPTDHLMLKPL
ncbi:MAG: hypothetical protein ACLP5V_10465 [Candidatus Bathyarchaeia archaeon]